MMFRSCVWLMAWLSLAGCEPLAEQKADFAERRRVECLDKLCEGDVLPTYNTMTLAAIKLNGQWFIGPKDYFSTGLNGAGFEWWDHKSLSSSMKRPPEAQALSNAGKGYDFSVEIFLRSNNSPPRTTSWYQDLLLAESQGRVISKTEVKPGVEAWRVKDEIEKVPPIWYVAKNLTDSFGDPPILFCRNANPESNRCTGGFRWQPGISADFRFHAKHGPDWPEIYQEIIRVLNLLKKA